MLMDGAYDTPTVAEGVILDEADGDPRNGAPYRKTAGITPNNGTIQVVAGNGGTVVGRKGTMPVMCKIEVEHGSVIVDIDGDTLRGTMVNKFGEIKDVFSLVKRGQVVHQRLAAFRQADVVRKTAHQMHVVDRLGPQKFERRLVRPLARLDRIDFFAPADTTS